MKNRMVTAENTPLQEQIERFTYTHPITRQRKNVGALTHEATPRTNRDVTDSDRHAFLAAAITNWLADRPLMRLNNTPVNIAFLLCDEMRELHEALEKRKESPPDFDETPGEIADLIFFACSILNVLQQDLDHVLESTPRSATWNVSPKELDHLASEIHFAAGIDDEAILTKNTRRFLDAIYAFSFALGYDPTAETLEKTAYNHTRYMAGRFQMPPLLQLGAQVARLPFLPQEFRTHIQEKIEAKFKEVKKAGRKETKLLQLKAAFYNIQREHLAGEKAPIPHFKTWSLKERAVRLATQTTSMLQGLRM